MDKMTPLKGEECFKAEIMIQDRITIPKVVRDILDIGQGDIIEVKVKKVK